MPYFSAVLNPCRTFRGDWSRCVQVRIYSTMNATRSPSVFAIDHHVHRLTLPMKGGLRGLGEFSCVLTGR